METKTKGHWPKGKRRNEDTGWSRTRLGLTKLFDDYLVHGQISRCVLAGAIGVNEKSVRRWLSGEDRPAPEYQALCAQWLKEAKALAL